MASVADVSRFTGATLVITQTVLNEGYWHEIMDGLESKGLDIRAFVLHSDTATLIKRIESDAAEDEKVKVWRLRHVGHYEKALPWLKASGTLVDTTHISADAVTAKIRDSL